MGTSAAGDGSVGVWSGVSTWFTKTYTLGGVMVATKTDGVVHYVSSDHLGSTSVSHNTSTGSTGTVTYFPFGAERSRTGFVDTDRTFTGQVSDAGTGLMFYNARYYDPVAGRFTQADTILADGPNRYSYVRNNPLARIDPSGNCSEIVWHDGGAFTCVIHRDAPGDASDANIEIYTDETGHATCNVGHCPNIIRAELLRQEASRQRGLEFREQMGRVADVAAAVADVATGVEIGALAASPACPGVCHKIAVVAGGVAVGASGVEVVACGLAGEPGHVFWGSTGVVTFGLGRAVKKAQSVDDVLNGLADATMLMYATLQQYVSCVANGCGPFDPLLSDPVVVPPIEGPAAGASTGVHGVGGWH